MSEQLDFFDLSTRISTLEKEIKKYGKKFTSQKKQLSLACQKGGSPRQSFQKPISSSPTTTLAVYSRIMQTFLKKIAFL